MAAKQPEQAALKIPRGRSGGKINYLSLSFSELDDEVNAWAAHLNQSGVRSGDRVLVMVRQGLPLISAAFALFKIGAVPIISDPGMGRESFLSCVARSKPKVLLGIPSAQFFSYIFRRSFATVDTRLWVSGSPTARRFSGREKPPAPVEANSKPDDLAAILFTSGSTGSPKGVCYEHGMFDAQVRLVRDTYGIQPGEIDLPLLPIFALFNPALGMTTIVPEMDPSRPATLDPAKIVQAIQQEGVTNSFGSPTLWGKITTHCREKHVQLPSMRRVLMAGAPVPTSLYSSLRIVIPRGVAHSPYGATEALPVTSITGIDVLKKTSNETARGAGTCVGQPVADVSIRIIAINEGSIEDLSSTRELAPGEIGEIIVCGPIVTRQYDALPEATAAAKIHDGAAVWHRMGDIGYFDDAGRLWFCGRKAERVETENGTLYTEQCEPIFNAHPLVARTALIGIGERGRQRAAIVAEPRSPGHVATSKQRRQFARELSALAVTQKHTERIRHFFIHPNFPVDVRHNAKIHRLSLAEWARDKPAYEMDPRKGAAEIAKK